MKRSFVYAIVALCLCSFLCFQLSVVWESWEPTYDADAVFWQKNFGLTDQYENLTSTQKLVADLNWLSSFDDILAEELNELKHVYQTPLRDVGEYYYFMTGAVTDDTACVLFRDDSGIGVGVSTISHLIWLAGDYGVELDLPSARNYTLFSRFGPYIALRVSAQDFSVLRDRLIVVLEELYAQQ